MPPRRNTPQREVAAEERTARGRIAVAANERGWQEQFDDVASNVRIYTRGRKQILVGYRPDGGVTGAHRGVIRQDKNRTTRWSEVLTQRDSGKADTVLGWLTKATRQ
jgi:hypothetical protein